MRVLLAAVAGLLLACNAAACARCGTDEHAQTPPSDGDAETGEAATSFIDVLPVIDKGWVYGEKGDFAFPLPQGWIVVPVPPEIYRSRRGIGFEEILMRPELALENVPYIRVSRVFGLKFKFTEFKGNEPGAAMHLLDQFIAGKYKKNLVGVPVLDTEQGMLSFMFTSEPATDETNRAAIIFQPDYTVMLVGAFSKAGKTWPDEPYNQVLSGFKARIRKDAPDAQTP